MFSSEMNLIGFIYIVVKEQKKLRGKHKKPPASAGGD